MKSYVTIAIDGPDGSGKTTQIELLKTWLESEKKRVLLTKSSGGTPIGQALRKVSLSDIARPAETDLYISLAMGVALADDLKVQREQYDVILIDRSPLSVIAYQNFGSQLKDQQLGYDACEMLLRSWKIDLLLVFEISESTLDQRNKQRQLTHPEETVNYFEQQDKDYKHRVHRGYAAGLNFAHSLADLKTNIRTINAAQSEKLIQTEIQQVLVAL